MSMIGASAGLHRQSAEVWINPAETAHQGIQTEKDLLTRRFIGPGSISNGVTLSNSKPHFKSCRSPFVSSQGRPDMLAKYSVPILLTTHVLGGGKRRQGKKKVIEKYAALTAIRCPSTLRCIPYQWFPADRSFAASLDMPRYLFYCIMARVKK